MSSLETGSGNAIPGLQQHSPDLLRDGPDRVDWMPSTRWARHTEPNTPEHHNIDALKVFAAEDKLADAILQEKYEQELQTRTRTIYKGDHSPMRKLRQRLNESKKTLQQLHVQSEAAFDALVETYKQAGVRDPDHPGDSPETLARKTQAIIQERLSSRPSPEEEVGVKKYLDLVARDHTSLREQLDNPEVRSQRMPSYDWANLQHPPLSAIAEVTQRERELVKAIDARDFRDAQRPLANEKRVKEARSNLASAYQAYGVAFSEQDADKKAQEAQRIAEARFQALQKTKPTIEL